MAAPSPSVQGADLLFRQLRLCSVRRACCFAVISGALLVSVRRCPAQKPSGTEVKQCAGLADNEKVHCQGVFGEVDAAQQAEDDADAAARPVLAKLSRTQTLAYRQLKAAFEHFLRLQITGDFLYPGAYGGTGLARQWERADFAMSIAAANTHHTLTSPDYSAADGKLNAIYRKLRARWNTPPSSASPKNGLVAEEEAWILYRDAWVRFGAALHPELPSTYWLQWSTEQRTHDLQQVYTLAPVTAPQ